MNFGKTEEIAALILERFPKLELKILEGSELQNQIEIPADQLVLVCGYLYKDPKLFFDFLNSITCIDNGVEAGTLDLIYTLTSIPFEFSVHLKIVVSRELDNIISVDSISAIWKSADWHEREIFDLFGLKFENHTDLRRILLPSDWEGHPLRKDYQEQAVYHGIKVKY